MNEPRIQLKAGEVLFAEGDPPTSAFLVEAGELELSSLIRGKRLVVSTLHVGDVLGEMAVFDDGPRSTTATAVSDCVLFVIDPEQMSERLSKTDPIIRALLEGQERRIRRAIRAVRGAPAALAEVGSAAESVGVEQIRLETHLREALAGDGLEVRYQPIQHVASGQIAGYEALVRWNHPDRGPVSPLALVGLAEESGLIVLVGEYMFDTACNAVRQLIEHDADPTPFVAVNVSARQLQHPGLIERIVARVEAAQLPRGSLKIEITESLALDHGLVAAAIALCRRHGIGVALDDFGTGYSHLAQLHTLEFDTLKVDKAFSRGMLDDPRSMAIVEAIVRMAKALDASIVVEGIETPEMLEALRRLGCDYAQGFLIGRPQTLDELLG